MLEAPNKSGHKSVECSHSHSEFGQTFPAPAADEVKSSIAGSGQNGNVPKVRPESWASISSRSTYSVLTASNKLDPRYTFDCFVVGPGNQTAYAASVAVAKQPGGKRCPLLLCGPVGMGKTHLATAIAHQVSRSTPERKVFFTPAELFIDHLAHALTHDRIDGFRESMRQVDVLIVDDVNFMAGRGRLQQGFLHIFNDPHAERRQIVLTSDRAPQELSDFEEPLIERFRAGYTAEIAPPDLDTRIAILHKKAAAEEVQLDPEVAIFICEKLSSNVRELEGCFNRLAALSSVTKRQISLDFARESLRDMIRDENTRLDVYKIQQHVADLFHIQVADLRSKKRTQHISFCRQVAMYLCRKLTGNSFPNIGDHFDRDHSTVIHAYNLVARRVKNEASFRRSMEKIERDLKILVFRSA